jgi:hypothetical protein
MKKMLLLLVAIVLVEPLHAQLIDDSSVAEQVTDASVAPLYVFTNGPGRIYAFERLDGNPFYLVQAGETLPVGNRVVLYAVPNPGYQFKNWNLVNVFTLTSTIVNDLDGTVITNNSSINVSKLPTTFRWPEMVTEVQPPIVLFTTYTTNLDSSIVTNNVLTAFGGWQANFVSRRR